MFFSLYASSCNRKVRISYVKNKEILSIKVVALTLKKSDGNNQHFTVKCNWSQILTNSSAPKISL